nr:PepSY-associated TM helix domain-containing protein [uncultured Holophaga sp.]
MTPERPGPSRLHRLSRTLHEWLGLVSSLLICIIAISGIYLNHRELFNGGQSRGPESHQASGPQGPRPEGTPESGHEGAHQGRPDALQPEGHHQGQPQGALQASREHGRPGGWSLTTESLTRSDTFPRLLQAVDQAWGQGVPLESIILRRDGRGLVWRIRSTQGAELHLDHRTLQVVANRPASGGGMNLGKLMHDLHSGQIAGTTGKLIVDLVGLVLVALSLTGWVLWLRPRLLRRRLRKAL